VKVSFSRRIIQIILTALTISTAVFIFWNSSKSAEDSTALSTGVMSFLQSGLNSFNIGAELTDHIVRKTAHFVEYATFGFLLMFSFRSYTSKIKKYIWIPILITVITPIIDECIQLFSPGRAFLVSDMLLDTAGALVGAGISCFLLWLYSRIFNRVLTDF
jgi:VanZ family protein